MPEPSQRPSILTATLDYISSSGENMNFEHQLAVQLAGTLEIINGNTLTAFKEGEYRFIVRNHTARFRKKPDKNGEFRSVSIALDKNLLKETADEYGFRSEKNYDGSLHLIKLDPNPHLHSFFHSLKPYLPLSNDNEPLIRIKLKEAVLMLIKLQPELKDILFDFDDPAKIPLRPFMEQNYRHNIKLPRFAYLTGRSLSGFKRDFLKEFGATPGKWLHDQRLESAYYLIKETGKTPSEVYSEVGFEDLSHFTSAFKKRFGISPGALDDTI